MPPAFLKCLPPLLAALCLPLAAHAGYRPGFGWPEVSTPFYHATTAAQAASRVGLWSRLAGHVIGRYRDTGSMRPVLFGGQELLAMEVCRADTRLRPGQIVQFNRGDIPAALHYIAAVSADGRHLYLSGVHNRYSDGWFSRDTVAYVVREIITAPDPRPLPLPGRTAVAAPAGESRVRQP